jgi:hypothetical protein
MKKIIAIALVLVSLSSYSQNLDTVNVSLTLRAQDWSWGIGRLGVGTDSATRAKVRAIRDAVRLANPQNWTTNVTITVNGSVIIYLYKQWISCPAGVMLNMGSNQAERATIYTNIRAISNSALQYYIGVIDANASNQFTQERNSGKSILIDN